MPSEYMDMAGRPVEVDPNETPEERKIRERELPAHLRTQEFGLLPGVTTDMGPANRDPDFSSSAPWRREGADPSERPDPNAEPEAKARYTEESVEESEPALAPKPASKKS